MRRPGRPKKDVSTLFQDEFLIFLAEKRKVTPAIIEHEFLQPRGLVRSNAEPYLKRFVNEGFLQREEDQWILKTDLETTQNLLKKLDTMEKKIVVINSPYWERVVQEHFDDAMLHVLGSPRQNKQYDDEKIVRLLVSLSPTAFKLAFSPFFGVNTDRSIYKLGDYGGNKEFVKKFLHDILLLDKTKLRINDYRLIELFINCMTIDYFTDIRYRHFIEYYRELYPRRYNEDIGLNWDKLRQLAGQYTRAERRKTKTGESQMVTGGRITSGRRQTPI